MTAAEAAEGTPRGAVAVPDLDGELTTDPAALAAVADDFGHLVHRTPLAVLRPGSVGDVVALVRYANRHGIAVSMRGQGHSTNGQSQVHAGVVIDSSTLGAGARDPGRPGHGGRRRALDRPGTGRRWRTG